MSALENLRALASGVPGANGLLGACRLESGGVDAFGGEAVADAFRRSPMVDAAIAVAMRANGQLALFGESEAIFADLFADNIGRLWRVGQLDPGTSEAAVRVAFDTDLQQARADVFLSKTDHPALDADGAAQVRAIGRGLVLDTTPDFAAFRTRAFAVRAFSDGSIGCALFAVHALAPNPRRTPSLTLAATRWDGTEVQVLRDPFRPRFEHVRIVA